MASCNCNHDPCGGALNQLATRSAQYAQYAQAQAEAIAASIEGFNEKYLGGLPTPPAGPQQEGALYFNTTDDTMYVWTGTAWQDFASAFNQNTNYQVTGTPTARNLVSRGADVINVKDFGAVGDGVTECGPAFRAAFALANTKLNACVYVPQGVYQINTFEDGTGLPWQPPFPEFNRSSIRLQSYDIERSIAFIGEGATITTDIWPNYPKDVAFNGGYTPSPIYSLINFEGKYHIIVDGITFINPFGGPGQKPIIPAYSGFTSGQASNNIVPYGRTIAIGTHKFANPPSNTYSGDGSLIVTNCQFRDFGCPINLNSSHSHVFIDNNYFVQTYGKMSAHNGGFPGGLIHFSNGPFFDKITITNNYFAGYDLPIVQNPDGSFAPPDMTFLQAYSQTKTTVQGVSYLFNFIELPENAIHIDGALNTASIIIANNHMKGFWIEAIKLDRYPDAASLQNVDGQTIIDGNIIDNTRPLGSQVLSTYGGGIVVNGQDATITNNHIKNAETAIHINQQARQEDLKNFTITGNTIEYKGIATTGYQGSPQVLTPTGISIDAVSNAVVDSNTIYFDNIGNPIPGNPTISAGNILFVRGTTENQINGNNNNIIVSNNVAKLTNKRLANLKYVAIADLCFGTTYKDNAIYGWDVFAAQAGGRIGATPVIDAGNYFDGSEGTLNINGQALVISSKTQDFKIYPTSTGWYQVITTYEWMGDIGIKINVPQRSYTGDGFSTQRTELYINYSGNPYDSSNHIDIKQLSHLSQGETPITQIAASTVGAPYNWPIGLWFYVDQVLERIPLKIEGGGGSGAAATATVINGVIQSVAVNSPGTGYTSPPTISVSKIVGPYQTVDIVGSGATFSPAVSGGGLQSVGVTNGGSGYAAGIHLTFENKSYLDYGPTYVGPLSVRKIIKSDGTSEAPIPNASTALIMPLSFGRKSILMRNPAGLNSGANRTKNGDGTPLSAAGVPSSTPEFIGQEYLDTNTNKFYKAKGTASSADWIALN